MGSKENTGQESPEDSMSYLFGPSKYWTGDPRDLLVASDAFDLFSFIRDATPGWGASKKKALKAMEKRALELPRVDSFRITCHKRHSPMERPPVIKKIHRPKRQPKFSRCGSRAIPRLKRINSHRSLLHQRRTIRTHTPPTLKLNK